MTITDIHRLVLAAGGIRPTTMEEIRDAYGSGRLKHLVLAAIRRRLEVEGLRWLPAGGLPNDQSQTIVLYAPETPAGQLLDLAVRMAGHETAHRRRIEAA